MPDLTDRQIQILKSIVEEYTNTAEPVGSETLDKKYNLGVSPATIRNEMAYLAKLGYLSQPHTSAGRIPSPQALRLYINELMKEKQLSATEEVAVKERIWDRRYELGQLLREATKALSQRTGAIGVAVTDDLKCYHAGYANVLDMPEFFDIDVTRSVLSLLDEANQLMEIFKRAVGDDPLHILIGDELGYEHLSSISMVFTEFQTGSKHGQLGVIGSCRLDYPYIIPIVRYFGNLISEIRGDW